MELVRNQTRGLCAAEIFAIERSVHTLIRSGAAMRTGSIIQIQKILFWEETKHVGCSSFIFVAVIKHQNITSQSAVERNEYTHLPDFLC